MSDELREIASCLGLTIVQEGSVRPASMSYVTPAEAVRRITAHIKAGERDTELLNSMDDCCRAIDMRFDASGRTCFRWQIDAWGNKSNRPHVRQVLEEKFGDIIDNYAGTLMDGLSDD